MPFVLPNGPIEQELPHGILPLVLVGGVADADDEVSVNLEFEGLACSLCQPSQLDSKRN